MMCTVYIGSFGVTCSKQEFGQTKVIRTLRSFMCIFEHFHNLLYIVTSKSKSCPHHLNSIAEAKDSTGTD